MSKAVVTEPIKQAASDARIEALCRWAQPEISRLLPHPLTVPPAVTGLGGDASFRRYFRYTEAGQSFLLVDAPAPHEDVGLFVSVAAEFHATGMRTPLIHAADPQQGFMLLEDFGDSLFLPVLIAAQQADNEIPADRLYRAAMGSLLDLQRGSADSQLPPYDATRLLSELQLFDQWFCGEMLGLVLDEPTRHLLNQTWQFLIDAAVAQPQVRVHRDYHSRNLMIVANDLDARPGVIDFQDAVVGPITYDLVSLLKDCYIVWPAPRVQAWLAAFHEKASEQSLLPDSLSFERFNQDFDLMGLQRHIKVLGIFCRLALRDGKRGYLRDLPVVLNYVQQTAKAYPELGKFAEWFEQVPLPRIRQQLQQESG